MVVSLPPMNSPTANQPVSKPKKCSNCLDSVCIPAEKTEDTQLNT